MANLQMEPSLAESWQTNLSKLVNCRLEQRLVQEPEAEDIPLAQAHRTVHSFLETYNVKVVSHDTPIRDCVESIINEQQSERAFYVMDLGVLLYQLEQWKALLPRVKPFYAVKCNPHPAILNFLALLGVGFDCASKGEIDAVLGLMTEVPTPSIIFANPCKQVSHLLAAKERNVAKMTFDNAEELRKIAKYYPEAHLVLRILTDESFSVMRFGSKFGATQSSIHPLLSLARDLGLNVVGVSFHVGSACLNPKAYAAALRLARNVFDIAKGYGFTFTLLDIGGGFPGTPANATATKTTPSGTLSFPEIAAVIAPTLDELFDDSVTVIAEPGRYFAMATQTLAVNVFAARDCTSTEAGGDGNALPPTVGAGADDTRPECLYYINEGVYGAFNCKVFDHYNPEPLLLHPAPADACLLRTNIFGPTCDSMDLVCKNKLLPRLSVGDWLYFTEMGAYTTASSSAFNGFKTDSMFFILRHSSWS